MSEWQPIETAPKNSYIIGAWPDKSRWRVAQLYWGVQEAWIDAFSDRRHVPTHWMPLPEPPK